MSANDDLRITADDVRDLNRASVERTAAIARLVGNGLVIAGAVVLLAWLWVSVRGQQQLGRLTIGFDASTGRDLADRVDTFIGSLGMLSSGALVLGLGFVVRLLADYAQTQVGGSVTGFVEGDQLA
jgi:hypothetical protein